MRKIQFADILILTKELGMQYISKYAIFNFDKNDANVIEEIANHLDKKAEEIFDFFEVEIPQDKAIVNIVSSKDKFNKLFKEAWSYEPENYSVGFAKNNIITYLSIFEYDKTTHAYKKEDFLKALDYYKKTLVHEFVHYVNYLFKKKHDCGYTERYLSEGLATCLSGQKDGLDLVFDETIDDLLTKRDCYKGYYLVTRYLLNNYSKEVVFEIIKSNRKARELLSQELYDKAKKYYNSLEIKKIHN